MENVVYGVSEKYFPNSLNNLNEYSFQSCLDLHLHCSGSTGHGSLLLKNTAGEKVRLLLDKFLSFRANEAKKLEEDADKTIGDVTTVNVTKLYVGSKTGSQS